FIEKSSLFYRLWREAGIERVAIAGIDEAHMRDRARLVPGASFDDEARGRFGDRKHRTLLLVDTDRKDLVLGSTPGNLAQQPRPRRRFLEPLIGRFRYGLKIDQALFEAEGLRSGIMRADDLDEAGILLKIEHLPVLRQRLSPHTPGDLVGIGE